MPGGSRRGGRRGVGAEPERKECPERIIDSGRQTRAVFQGDRLHAYDLRSGKLAVTFPKGLDVEVARTEALRVAAAEAEDPTEREHVMPFLYRHPERFRLATLRSTERLGREIVLPRLRRD